MTQVAKQANGHRDQPFGVFDPFACSGACIKASAGSVWSGLA